MPTKRTKLNILSIIFSFVLPPVFILLCMNMTMKKNYYAAAVLIIISALIPFFAYFEKRKIKTGEVVIIAIITALAVSSRCVMMFIPQVKPTCAVVITSAMAFGPNVGFLIGAMSMFLSNFVFGQGSFTPFQMLGMGLVGFLCGVIFKNKKIASSKITVSITGAVLCFAVYGFIVDSCSVLMLSSTLTLEAALPFYVSGIPFNAIHALTTGILLFFINKPMADKFSRLRIKYGIFSYN